MEEDQRTALGAPGSERASLASLSVDALVPAIDGLLFLVARDGLIHDFRAGTASLPFVPPEEFLGRNIADVLPPDVAEQILPVLSSVAPGEAPAVSYWLPGPTGHEAYEARILLLANELCLAFVNHVTDRFLAEQELHARTEMLRAILQAEPECVKVIDRAGALVEINPAGLEILEVESLDDARDQPLVDFLQSGQDEAWLEMLEKVWAGNEATVEVEIVGRRGTNRWLDITAAPLRGPDGDVQSVLAVSRDVTARRAAEEALRESERRLAQATSVGNIGIFEFDLEAGSLYWSREMREIFGRDPDETGPIDPGSVLQQFHPEDIERVARDTLHHRTPDSGGFYVTDQRILREDTGEVRWVNYRSRTLFDGEGPDARPIRTIGAVQDISDRLSLEHRLAQAERLDSIGRLAGGIAHDFNNMLTAILGFAQLIEEDVAAGAPVAPDDLRQISAAAERARDLTSQLLAFARRQPSQPRSVDLNDEVRESRRLVGQLLREDIDLRLDLASDLWPVHIDPGHVEQVLMNLILNAQDAMPDGGAVDVATANVQVERDLVGSHPGLTQGHYVRLTVTDDGVGIAPEVLPRVFEPFFTTKSMGDGTGLGLATVYGIVGQNDGHIGVRSEPGGGSTFEVYLPRAPEQQQGSAVADGDFDDLVGDETLLVVEDDDSVRSLTARLLEDAGYRVHVAASPVEAISLLRTNDEVIDLLVTDVVMPQMSGRALADVLRAMRPRLRVLFVSGYSDTAFGDDDDEDRLEFLAKPYTPLNLRARVRAILDSAG